MVILRQNSDLCVGAIGKIQLFSETEYPEFSEKFSDMLWCAELVYITYILLKLKTMNARMQDEKQNLISASDKMIPFSKKHGDHPQKMWICQVSPFMRYYKSAKS